MPSSTVPASTGKAELTEKKSRFIGEMRHVTSQQEALDFISEVRAQFPDARHVVYAYTVRENGTVYTRYSDDGEPQGTGGVPVLDVIQKLGLSDAAVTVTRYFGGILLGASGLTRMYSKAASEAAKNAGKAECAQCVKLKVKVSYTDAGKVRSYSDSLPSDTKIYWGEPEYGADVTFYPEISTDILDSVTVKLTDITSGRAQISDLGKCVRYFKGE